jgi:hypothetical protein
METHPMVDVSSVAHFSCIGPLDLIGMWSGDDQRANTIKTNVEKILECVFKY